MASTTSTSSESGKLQKALLQLAALNETKSSLLDALKNDVTSLDFSDLKIVIEKIKTQELEIKKLEALQENEGREQVNEINPETTRLTHDRDCISKWHSSLRREIDILAGSVPDLKAKSQGAFEVLISDLSDENIKAAEENQNAVKKVVAALEDLNLKKKYIEDELTRIDRGIEMLKHRDFEIEAAQSNYNAAAVKMKNSTSQSFKLDNEFLIDSFNTLSSLKDKREILVTKLCRLSDEVLSKLKYPEGKKSPSKSSASPQSGRQLGAREIDLVTGRASKSSSPCLKKSGTFDTPDA
jgi:hypothetical protein